MLKLDVIEKVEGTTSWVNPLVVVEKSDGDIRICLDMRQANQAIVREKHPVPTVEETLQEVSDAKVFSEIDLHMAFHQLSCIQALALMASRRAFLGSRILALILVSICLVNWDFNSNLSFLELDQVCIPARYHPHRSFDFFDFDFHTLVEERRHFGSSFYRGGGYLSCRISLYPNSVSTFQLV